MDRDVIEMTDRLRVVFADITRLASRGHLQRTLHGHDARLTPTDGWLLRHLAAEGPSRVSQLAHWQAVDRSTMTSQVARLERAGLVSRAADPQDGRVAIISVTRDGVHALESGLDAARALFGDVLSDWSPAERRVLVESLERLTLALEDRLDDDVSAGTAPSAGGSPA
ncbi:hypothetical protein BW730_17615 [Tessaracoccus aquimaris]|uniref:HTH marR-type domain-containing protein n=1 Tax=Tessaracoccus aquimaris TaxID=1332264 RepID=A0A1Q2CSF5_9ACTN|nr:MarR family transcriptional regulator [Tessaracoccus aquimaris]AQP49042.1 hypothetical protein BW730_17615 [Tessaracoccus aquimaris]